jgi:hypothetical protein
LRSRDITGTLVRQGVHAGNIIIAIGEEILQIKIEISCISRRRRILNQWKSDKGSVEHRATNESHFLLSFGHTKHDQNILKKK